MALRNIHRHFGLVLQNVEDEEKSAAGADFSVSKKAFTLTIIP